MKRPVKKILGVVLAATAILTFSHALAQVPPNGNQTSAVKPESERPTPNLADFIPLTAELSGRLTVLEQRIESGEDVASVGDKCTGIEANLTTIAGQLQKHKDTNVSNYRQLVELRDGVIRERKLLDKIDEPLSKSILRVDGWRKEWMAEKKRWEAWHSSVVQEGTFDKLQSTFDKANETIDRALALILQQLRTMLAAQEKTGNCQAKMVALTSELDGLISLGGRSSLLERSPPMFSYGYFSQFGSELWYAVLKGLDAIPWPDGRFVAQQGWVILLQSILSLVVIVVLHRNRRMLQDSRRWRFLGARPVSAGLFLSFMTTLGIYEYMGTSATWRLFNVIVCGVSYVRLSENFITALWKRHFIYGLTVIIFLLGLMYLISIPPPLFRLFIFLSALVGLAFFLRWARESSRQESTAFYTWSLRLGACLSLFVILAELWGQKGLAQYVFISSIRTVATILIFILFKLMVQGGLEWLFQSSYLRRVAIFSKNTDAMIQRASRFISIALGLVLLPAMLKIWGAYNSYGAATSGVLKIGFDVGSQRISVGVVVASAAVLYGSFLTSWILQKLLIDEVLVSRRVEYGVRHSIARLVHYVIVLLGFLLAISALGFDVTKLTIMLSALGVGIGLGLQGVVNNFVSGLILLFERPLRQGDTIEFGGTWAEIKRIGLRATTVQTFDSADVIIPNADLVSNKVTNWTLSNRRVRIIIPVGVAYGSDVSLVMETLITCAKSNSKVARAPSPQVLFLGFGESSLDFELRVHALDVNEMLRVKSELHQEIDRSFRNSKIEIAFPQRDLHVRSVGDAVVSGPPERSK